MIGIQAEIITHTPGGVSDIDTDKTSLFDYPAKLAPHGI
jgi:hypothetical protein